MGPMRFPTQIGSLAFLLLSACEYSVNREDSRSNLVSVDSSSVEEVPQEKRFEDPSCAPSVFNQSLANAKVLAYYTKNRKYHYSYSSKLNFAFSDLSVIQNGSFQKVTSNKIDTSDAKKYLNPIYSKREFVFSGGDQKLIFEKLGLTSLRCSILLVSQIKRFDVNGGLVSTVQFEPALPYFPAAGEKDNIFANELGAALQSGEIVAKVLVATKESDLKVGQTFKTKTKISYQGEGAETSDKKIKIESIFGSPRQSINLGLFPTASWQINERKILKYEVTAAGIIIEKDLALEQTVIIYQ